MKFHIPKARDLSGILANRTFLKIMLIKKDKMLLTNEEVAKEFNQYFGHINDSLDLYESFYEKFWEELVDIDSIVCKFTDHPSYQKIKEWYKFKGNFSSRLATTEGIKVIIRDLPTNKAAWGKIPVNILKKFKSCFDQWKISKHFKICKCHNRT